MQNQDNKSRYANKGGSITHAGYETGVHALPSEVKDKLDSYLRSKYSPARILAQLSQEFPEVSLPSRSALYNYRKRYFEQSIVSATPVAKIEESFDADKVRLRMLVVNQVKRFAAVDLPVLRDRWYMGIEYDQKHGAQLSKTTKDAGRLYLESVKLIMDILPKMNLRVELIEDKPVAESPFTEAQKNDVYERLARIMNKRVGSLVSRGIPITPETLKPEFRHLSSNS